MFVHAPDQYVLQFVYTNFLSCQVHLFTTMSAFAYYLKLYKYAAHILLRHTYKDLQAMFLLAIILQQY